MIAVGDKTDADSGQCQQIVPAPLWRRAGSKLRRLASLFGQQGTTEPVSYGWFSAHEVRRLFELTIPDLERDTCLDEQTWSDLHLDRYLELVVPNCSILGRQWLHRRLRVVGDTEPLERLLKIANDARGLLADDLLGLELMQPLRNVALDLSEPLHAPASHRLPDWVKVLWIVPVTFGVALALTLTKVSPLGAIFVGAAAIVAGGWVQVRLYQRLTNWLRVRKAVVTMLRVACALLRQFELDTWRIDECLPGTRVAISRAPQLLALFRPSIFESIPALAEYTNLLALYEFRRQRHHVETLERERAGLCKILEVVGRLEALGWLAQHVGSQGNRICWSRRSATGLRFDDVVSPLVDASAGLSLEIDGQGILLTGKNGVGKSTLLRTIGLNALTSGAFGFCYARSASCAAYLVLTSMQVVDSLERGLSTYMAELQRAKKMLDASCSPPHTLMLIDEIFSGTNHLESISAGYAVLSSICERSAVVVATHDVVLAPLLEGKLRPLRLSTRQGDRRSMYLEPGTIAETNGISMMADYGFAPELVQRAHRVHHWLAQYLSYPVDGPPVK